MLLQNPHISYSQKEQYYESLKPAEIPAAWFAGDLMHYLFAEDLARGKKVLDLGCGLGYGSYHLALENAREVIGIDLSEERLSEAKERFSHPGLEFLSMDAMSMSFPDETFDLVISFEVLEHLPASSTHPFMEEIARVLKANGKFIISTPNRDAYSLGSGKSKTTGHINELFAQEFVQLMYQYFRKCDFFYQFKYTECELELKKEEEARLRNSIRSLFWKGIIPGPVKRIIKSVIRPANLSCEDADLAQYMQLWEVKPAETITDLELSVIQMAVCEDSLLKPGVSLASSGFGG